MGEDSTSSRPRTKVHPQDINTHSSSGCGGEVGDGQSQATVNGFVASSDVPSHGDDSGLGKEEEEWPVNRCLPFPKWGCQQSPDLNFVNLQQYERFYTHVTQHLRQALNTHCYDTLSNFIKFGEEYKSGEEYSALLEFFRHYDPPLLPGCYNCVGLAVDLTTRLSLLDTLYPGVIDATYQVSCQDNIRDLQWYCSFSEPPVESCVKDHVLLCVRVCVAGRSGVMLLDPAFHVAQPITVMHDGLYPQSGVIQASTTRLEVQRTFQYSSWPDNPAYVFWDMTEKREGKPVKKCPSLIYTSKPYLSSVEIAERCNLVYPFKTLLKRNSEGELTSGLYFVVREFYNANITFFHRVDGVVRHVKHPLSYFLDEGMKDREVEDVIATIAAGMDRSKGDLRANLVTLAHLLQDGDLVRQILDLNNVIHDICNERNNNSR